MKKIELTQGAYALVDDADYKALNAHSWWLGASGYAFRTIWFGRDQRPVKKNVSMHRELLALSNPYVLVDHINQNKLDNRRENLRLSNKSLNGCNRGPTLKNTTGYKGVTKHSQCKNRWIAQIKVEGKNYYLGMFDDPKKAASAYDAAAIKHFGQYANVNGVE